MRTEDVVITGPPRSGTTLSCELLNAARDTVALDEPMDDSLWPVPEHRPPTFVARVRRRVFGATDKPPVDPDAFCTGIERFFDDTRASLLAGKGAISVNYEGEVFGGKFADNRRAASGLRENVATRSVMPVDKPLSSSFVLVVKQISGFTAMLPALAQRFRAYAVVRNPLSILSSWQTIDAAVSRGHVPRGEHLDPVLRKAVNEAPDVLDKQLVIMRWFFETFRSTLPTPSVIRYEDIVASGGRALAVISSHASELERPLESRNRARVYDHDKMRTLGERLLGPHEPWWEYYSPESVREIMDAV